MTDKSAQPHLVAVAVAPARTGFMALGDHLSAACEDAGLSVTRPARLLGSENKWVAVELDVAFSGTDLAAPRHALQATLGSIADTALIPRDYRRKRLLVSDMDSTIIAQECLDELADYAGLKAEIAAITARAMAGELDFEGALTERVAKLKGLSLQALELCYRERITLMPGARNLTATMAAHGAHCLLVSGGFTYFTSRVAAACGFDSHQGNILLDDGAALTGSVGQPILGRAAKQHALEVKAKSLGILPEQTMAMGDGANDLAMIEVAGLGLAVHAKPVVASAADAAINITDLTAALYFQGYSDSEIVWRD